MATIYLSSTYEDLKDYRRVVFDALRKSGHNVIAMEDYVATDQRPVNQCLKDVERADIYIGLFAFRYGYVPPPQHNNPKGWSITELEFRRAEALKKPCLTFVAGENTDWPRSCDDARTSADKGERIDTLRQYLLTEKLASQFSAPHELSTLVLAAVAKHLAGDQPHPSLVVEWPEGKSPYPGLLWFNEEYAPLFFGRNREVDELVGKMSEPGGRVLIVSGASGSGKSSLVAAGLWHALINEGRLPGSKRWVWQRIQPGDGETPFHSLAWGLKQAYPSMSKRAPDLAKELVRNQTTIGELLALHLGQEQEQVLFIDQLDELFTQSFTNEDIRLFLERLIATACNSQSRLRVVATVRSEFIARLEESEPMLQVLNAGYNYHLGVVAPRTLQDMIEKPAQVTGYRFEPQLVDDILREAAQEPGGLPLVAYALKELFDRCREQTFTRDDYKAIGGVAGAIGTKADQVMQVVGEQVAGAFDTVFAELVHLERERPPTRKRASLAVFATDNAANQLIDALAGPECRILVKSGNEQDTVVEVAHEKLFTAWPKLRSWIDDSGEALRLIDYAGEAAHRWHASGSKPQKLWFGQDVNETLAALQRFGKKTSPELARFLMPQHVLIAQLDQGGLSHKDRLLIGQKLAEFGDPRTGVGLCPDGLPDIAWIVIPQGRIQLEGVDRTFEVKPFCMAKYLVTNAQFEAFLKAKDGYRNEEWWKGIQRTEASLASWQEANAPRETVSWYEAVAFCRWLSYRTRSTIRLPAEWEWQQAATGGDPTNEYPWPGEWDVVRCNSEDSRLFRTMPVGMYPSGATPQGVLDMVGNVWEWCLNTYKQPDLPESLRIDASDVLRVVRGGSWYSKPGALRISTRYRPMPAGRDNGLGFRLVQDIEE